MCRNPLRRVVWGARWCSQAGARSSPASGYLRGFGPFAPPHRAVFRVGRGKFLTDSPLCGSLVAGIDQGLEAISIGGCSWAASVQQVVEADSVPALLYQPYSRR